MNKPIYKSLTIIGGAIVVLVNYAQNVGLITPGTMEETVKLVEAAGALLGIYGIRRAIGPQ